MNKYEKIVNEHGADLNMDNEGETNDVLSREMRFARFNEDKIIKTLVEYIETTYGEHYVDGEKQTQTIETIRSDRIPGFCIGNISKYLDRYDKKGTPRSDLLKAAHYLIHLLNHENIYD